ncbi:hypothetical protein AAVH_34647, partial [Aphelenchoides avenae]
QKPPPSTDAFPVQRNFLQTLINEAVGPNFANLLTQSEATLRQHGTAAFTHSELNRTVIASSLYKQSNSFAASTLNAHVNNVGVRQPFSRPASAQRVDAPVNRSQTPQQPLQATTSSVAKNDFVTVPSNAATPVSTPTVLQSRSVTPQQANRDARTPGPGTPTNSNNHAAANTHPSPRPSILRTSAVRRLVEKDSRPPSAAATINIAATTSGRSSTPAPIGDNHVTKNNADASGSLDDSPRKRMRKQQFDNSQFLQDQVKMMEASPDGTDPSASTDAAYPLTKETRRRGRPRSNRSIMATSPNREESDASPRPYASSPALHSEVASTSHGVRNTDSPVVKKRKYTRRLLGATDNDVARRHLFKSGRPKKPTGDEWGGSRKNSAINSALRSMQPSTSTDERNAISILFGLAQKTDNKNTLNETNSDEESDNESDAKEEEEGDEVEQNNDNKDEDRVRVELDDLRAKFGDDFIDCLKECDSSCSVNFKAFEEINALIQRAYRLRNDAAKGPVGRKRRKNSFKLPNCRIYENFEEVKFLEDWLRLLPDAANYYSEAQNLKRSLRERLQTLSIEKTLKQHINQRTSEDAESDGATSDAFEPLGELDSDAVGVAPTVANKGLKKAHLTSLLAKKSQQATPHKDLLTYLDVAECIDRMVDNVVRLGSETGPSTSNGGNAIVASVIAKPAVLPASVRSARPPSLITEEFNYSPSQLPVAIRRQVSRAVEVDLGVFKRLRLKRKGLEKRRARWRSSSSFSDEAEEVNAKNVADEEPQERNWSSSETVLA